MPQCQCHFELVPAHLTSPSSCASWGGLQKRSPLLASRPSSRYHRPRCLRPATRRTPFRAEAAYDHSALTFNAPIFPANPADTCVIAAAKYLPAAFVGGVVVCVGLRIVGLGRVSGAVSSCRGPQAALKCSYRSDRVTRDGPVVLKCARCTDRVTKRGSGLHGPFFAFLRRRLGLVEPLATVLRGLREYRLGGLQPPFLLP